MKNTAPFIALAVLLLGLPPAGVWLAGEDVSAFLEFPPRTRYIEHAPFAWPVFIVLALVILALLLPFIYRLGRAGALRRSAQPAVAPARPCFPWWGWLGLGCGLLFWIAAWTRFPWMEVLQHYTFTPQWIAYIVVINALSYRRTGRCLMTRDTKFFLLLFPVSAAFWWFFEYLNRFVQNWYYVACESFTPLQYFTAAPLPFSTVLPAVLSTEEWLLTHAGRFAGLKHFLPVRIRRRKITAGWMLAGSAAGLFCIGQYPEQLFPLLWVAPLL
ncbi:MAG TPA: hypothetical protein VLL07_03035, partial [Pontiella sp.]|nr:hypothetical protein [Pontiella sp.]